MPRADLLRVVEKIFFGIADKETSQAQFYPLWQYPLVAEGLLSYLREGSEDHLLNLKTIMNWLCPHLIESIERLLCG